MVSNAGNIKVQGNQAIGILGMAYREDALNNAVVNELELEVFLQIREN